MRGFIAFLFASALVFAQDAETFLNQGIAAFKNGRYQDALEAFGKSIQLNPNDVNAHLYAGTTYLTLWIPGLATPDPAALARNAEMQFRRVLELDPNNTIALASLASLAFNEAAALRGDEKLRKLDEAEDWSKRLTTVDPTNKAAYYSLGSIAWAKWYPVFSAARKQAGLKPEDPGPLPEPVRGDLKSKYSAMIDEAIANLEHALMLDPQYSDAMAYLNLLVRERADLRETKAEYSADIATADQWVQKALDAKRNSIQRQSTFAPAPPPPPLPPPPPPSSGPQVASVTSTPQRVRVGGNVQAANLITKVDPVYPPLALSARISGLVRFTVIINKDGTVQNLQLVSGHPLLAPAATDAVKQYVYKQTVLNGTPVEVVTQVDVPFTLP